MVSEIDFDQKPNLLISTRNSRFQNSVDSFVPFNLKIKEMKQEMSLQKYDSY